MKSIKIYSTIIIFILFGNIIIAGNISNRLSLKERNLKSFFSFWNAKQISKYKHLAPVFPKEIPAEESITSFFKNVLSPLTQINEDNNESVENMNNLAPSFPKEIPVDEEITIISSNLPASDMNMYKNLAPSFQKEIPTDEEITIISNNIPDKDINTYTIYAPEYPTEIPVE